MEKRQFVVLFLSKLVIYAVGFGLGSLLPLYAAQLGAAPEAIGRYITVSIFSLCLGILVAGWLVDRWQRHKYWFCSAAVAYSVALFLMSQIEQFGQLIVFTAIAWFFGGMGLALVSIVAGLSTRSQAQGKVFSALELTQGLGGFVGGLAVGPLVDRWGFSPMFALVAGFSLLWLGAGLLLRSPQQAATAQPSQDVMLDPMAEPSSPIAKIVPSPQLNLAFIALLLSCAIANLIQPVDTLTRPLLMDSLDFNATAISSNAAMGIVGMPLLPLLGWLCDRTQNRHWLLMMAYGIGIVGMLGTASATLLWHFWGTAALLALASSSVAAIGSILVTQWMPKGSLGRRLSLFNVTLWLSNMIGATVTGGLLEQVGMSNLYRMVAWLPMAACLFLLPIARITQHALANPDR